MDSKPSTERHKRWRSTTSKRRVELWIDVDLYKQLNSKAKQSGTTVTEWIRELLVQGVQRLPSTPSISESGLPVNAQGVDGKHYNPLTVNAPTRLPSTPGKGARQGEADRRAVLAQQALALREEGLSWQRIAERWNTDGVPTLRGGRWDPSTVMNMVKRYQRLG